jgi:hypothetical protein
LEARIEWADFICEIYSSQPVGGVPRRAANPSPDGQELTAVRMVAGTAISPVTIEKHEAKLIARGFGARVALPDR